MNILQVLQTLRDDLKTWTLNVFNAYDAKVHMLTEDKMDKNDPQGTGSFSLNRKANTAIGVNSSAIGNSCVASGKNSHAEGYQAQATGENSHAEGYQAQATGENSHAEGWWTKATGFGSHAEGTAAHASGDRSHAEGSSTKAGGTDSHAEGWATEANGSVSHAEGHTTIANGYASHAEGYGTIANGAYSHVQGLNNIEDLEKKYLHIVGNGNIESNIRSNAHTLDWDGNAWFAGDVYIGSTSGTNKDAGSKKLATEDYVEGMIPTFPTSLKNPNALTFTGAATGTYDGSSAKTVNIVGKAGAGTSAEVFNYEFNKAVGNYSHAEGHLTYATGTASHAEGQYNYALGDNSHVEGQNNSACGSSSHAEGAQTLSYGHASHAEGSGEELSSRHLTGAANTKEYTVDDLTGINVGAIYRSNNGLKSAIVTSVNTGNNTITLNNTLSETEPYDSYGEFYISGIALSTCAHSEGKKTIAAGCSQHTQGEYNIIDPDYNVSNPHLRGRYAHIVGNGKSETARSNAHTLDWDGNAWFAGDVYAGGENIKDPLTKLVTLAEIMDGKFLPEGMMLVPIPSVENEGNILQVVNGQPTWVSIPSAESSTF